MIIIIKDGIISIIVALFSVLRISIICTFSNVNNCVSLIHSIKITLFSVSPNPTDDQINPSPLCSSHFFLNLLKTNCFVQFCPAGPFPTHRATLWHFVTDPEFRTGTHQATNGIFSIFPQKAENAQKYVSYRFCRGLGQLSSQRWAPGRARWWWRRGWPSPPSPSSSPSSPPSPPSSPPSLSQPPSVKIILNPPGSHHLRSAVCWNEQGHEASSQMHARQTPRGDCVRRALSGGGGRQDFGTGSLLICSCCQESGTALLTAAKGDLMGRYLGRCGGIWKGGVEQKGRGWWVLERVNPVHLQGKGSSTIGKACSLLYTAV